jgi:2-C-methyl-D-erythritol 2,4-cyclodiphosphate synthase
MRLRIGQGVDVHAFGPGDYLVLGGVRVPYSHGVLAHSDGDVLLHALTDALLGALALGDIGQWFPPSDPRWRDADSRQFVQAALQAVAEHGLRVINVDLTVLAEAPKIGPHREAIRAAVAGLLQIDIGAVGVKATTTEQLGFLGRGEGIGAMAVVLLGDGAVQP